ncbi:hypothetical protein Lepto7375DRAFT_2182 [Leptolyngbya sp. PCC 7375]|nr:hypothetical protein Lepto7375DRAFT_2182 [Leptolyngbya sp. PCC 7375]
MSNQPTDPVAIVLETYRKNIKKLIKYLSDCDSNEHGFYSSLTLKINRPGKLAKPIPDQYVPDWYNLRKAEKRGLDIPSAVKLGYGAGLHDDPAVAACLVYLALLGVWDLSEDPKELLFRIQRNIVSPRKNDPQNKSTQLNRIEQKLDTALRILGNQSIQPNPQALISKIKEELTKYGLPPTEENLPEIEKILLENAFGVEPHVPEIMELINQNIDPEPKHLLLLCVLLTVVNPEGQYTPGILQAWACE